MTASTNYRKYLYGVAFTSFGGGTGTGGSNLFNVLSKGLFTHPYMNLQF